MVQIFEVQVVAGNPNCVAPTTLHQECAAGKYFFMISPAFAYRFCQRANIMAVFRFARSATSTQACEVHP